MKAIQPNFQTYPPISTTPQLSRKYYSSTHPKWRRTKSFHSTVTTELSPGDTSVGSNSAVSSGFWEDYESLGQSEHENSNIPQMNSCLTPHTTDISEQQTNNQSDAEVVSMTSPVRLRSPRVDGSYTDRGHTTFKVKPTLEYEYLQVDLEAGQSKEYVKPFEPLPKSLSSDMASAYVQSLEDISETLDCAPHSTTSREVSPTAKSTPRKTPRSSILLGWRSSMACDEFSSDSEDDICSVDQIAEPKTQFEAALRRARMAQQQHEITHTDVPPRQPERAMPDWGSPIRLSKVRYPPSPVRKAHTNLSKSQSDGPLSQENILPVDRPTRAESPVFHYGHDLCTGIETWLSSRTHWIYKSHKTNTQALQLCFLSNYDQEFDSPMRSREPTVERQITDQSKEVSPPLSVNDDEDACTESFSDSQLTILPPRDTSTDEVVSSTRPSEGSLLRDKNATEGLLDRLNELDRFFRLYLEQSLQDCEDQDLQMVILKRLEKQKQFHSKTLLTVAQLPKIARMQLEVERYQWYAISPSISRVLSVNSKPRTLLSVSLLQQFTSPQLKLIINHLYEVIGALSTMLVDELTQRDDLHLEQGARCIELDDLAAYFKDLCIRASIRHFRRKISLEHPDAPRSSVPTRLPTNYLHVPQINGETLTDSNFQPIDELPSRRNSFSQRILSTLFGRRITH